MFYCFLFFVFFTSIGVADDNKKQPIDNKNNKEYDMCVGCNKDDKETNENIEEENIKIEVIIDPITGKVRYVIKGIEIKNQ